LASTPTTSGHRGTSSNEPFTESHILAITQAIVVTPSHNPSTDGGFKYNPPNGGPADTDVTDWIQNRANELLRAGSKGRSAYRF